MFPSAGVFSDFYFVFVAIEIIPNSLPKQLFCDILKALLRMSIVLMVVRPNYSNWRQNKGGGVYDLLGCYVFTKDNI